MADARGYGDLKAAAAEAVIAELAPVRERYAELRPDEAALEAILARGRRAGARDRVARRSSTCAPRWASARPTAGSRHADVPRRLVALIGAIVLVDTLLYAALAPLLPALEHEFGLRRPGPACSSPPTRSARCSARCPAAGRAARCGPRPSVLAGLALMTVSGVAFALAEHDGRARPRAASSRALGGAATWTAGLAWLGAAVPRERRGEAIGCAIGAGIFGAQFGPVVGVDRRRASGAGRRSRRSRCSASCSRCSRARAAPAPRPRTRRLAAAAGRATARFVAAAWLTFLPSLAFGVVEVLVPLRLDDLGASALAIGAAFFVAALVEALMSPLVGRVVDRRGVRAIVRGATLPRRGRRRRCSPRPDSAIVLAALLVVAAAALGALWTPSGSLVSLRAEQLGVDQGWAFALNNLGWSAGVAIGAGAGGALGQLVGDWLAYALCAALLARDRRAGGGRATATAPARPSDPVPPATVHAVIAAELELDLDVFTGPFDLLLTLVLREDVDLLEVELADVVVSYLDHLEPAR